MKKFAPQSAQQKMINVASGFGQKNIAGQQGTTRVIYDTLPLMIGETVYKFFENVNTRQFPLTNLQNGNRLEVGEMLTMQYGTLSLLKRTPATPELQESWNLFDLTGTIIRGGLIHQTNPIVPPLDSIYQEQYLSAAMKLTLAELSFMVGNTQTLKPIAVQTWHPAFNKSAKNNNCSCFVFDTLLTIPPMLEFVAPLKIIPLAPADFVGTDEGDFFVRLTLEGAASIISPRQTF